MRRSYFADRMSKWIAVADTTAIILSFTFSLAIRSQFNAYLVRPIDIIVLLPWLILLRVVTNVVFEHYTLNVSNFTPKDFSELFAHNLLPSAVMAVLRLVHGVPFLQLPFSVIAMEYIFTCFGFMIVRLTALRLTAHGVAAVARYRPHVLLWGGVREILDGKFLEHIQSRDEVRVVGILSPNALDWDTEAHRTRVYGDEQFLWRLLSVDETISSICFGNPRSEQRAELVAVVEIALKLRLSMNCVGPDGSLSPIDRQGLLKDSD